MRRYAIQRPSSLGPAVGRIEFTASCPACGHDSVWRGHADATTAGTIWESIDCTRCGVDRECGTEVSAPPAPAQTLGRAGLARLIAPDGGLRFRCEQLIMDRFSQVTRIARRALA